MANKWRECTTIPDYEFDPDGKYDGSLYKEDWDEIFNELYQRAETTEEWRYNDWIDPLSTRNAYTEYFEKGGEKFIVLKYYDGMYALYEIKDENEIDEKASKIGRVIEKIESGVSIRQAISEAVQVKNKVLEDINGMDQESSDKLLALMDDWTGGSGKNGWEYKAKKVSGNSYAVSLIKNPIAQFDKPVDVEMVKDVLNGEVYYEPADEYLAASGPVSFAGLKSILRDLTSQIEMTDADLNAENGKPDGDIFGY
jgi:hypothetical protein